MTTRVFNWRPTAVALAVGLCLGTTAYAQTNVTGNIFGQVQAAQGATVVVENIGTGLKRTLTPDANGRFVATALATGTYRVTLLRDGRALGTPQTVEVLIGQGSEVVFGSSAAAQTIEVTGRVLTLDTKSSNNGSTFTAKQLDSLPIAKNIDAIIQLAPNTTRADPRYSGGASFGGGAPSENSYYINGFPVTNPLNQLGSSELPFAAIQNAQILTGGFGAEFGRSIGGVVNITTKSGTNKWEGGISVSFSPEAFRKKEKDIFFPVTGASGNEASDGTLFRSQGLNTRDAATFGAYVGGPLITDKLFMFVAAERADVDRGLVNLSTLSPSATTGRSGWAQRANSNNRYLAKFDWNLTNDHILEATLIGDRYVQVESLSGYSYANNTRQGGIVSTATFTNSANQPTIGVGAASQILRYTGYLNQDLTVTALVGRSLTPHLNSFEGVDVFSNVHQVAPPGVAAFPGFTYPSPYPFPSGTLIYGPKSEDTVKASRFDLEYKLGSHLLRAGIDDVKLQSKNAGDVLAGNGQWNYFRTAAPSATFIPANLVPPGMTTSVGAGGALQSGGRFFYGREQIFSTITDAGSNQSAQYLEDKWQITKQLLITPGMRFEQYKNLNGDGETFLKVKNQINPRFAFAWDAMGDGSTKIFGSAGRYGVQIPTHLAVRGASRSTFTRQFFAYTGIDANGAPIGRVDLGAPFSANNEYGQAKDAKTVAALDMKPNSQDEMTLGIEKALSAELNVGARVTYRKLVATIDDLCDPRPFEKYAADNAINTTNWAGFGCASFNPGQANSFLVDYAGNGTYTRVNLSKEALGFDKAKRTYFALDLFAEHPLKNGWYGRVNYTYAQNKGNTEGQTLSDVAQTDVAATQTWDHPELMIGAYGNLPNDRRHQIKAYGFARVMPGVDVGANLLLASGRPKNCIGNFAGTPSFGTTLAEFDNISYGSAYRTCNFDGVQRATPRGSEGYLPWDTRLDLNVTFRPEQIKGLTLRVDVFNVFNRQNIQAIDEVHEVAGTPGDTTQVTTQTYGRVLSYTAPRSMRFSLNYDF